MQKLLLGMILGLIMIFGVLACDDNNSADAGDTGRTVTLFRVRLAPWPLTRPISEII